MLKKKSNDWIDSINQKKYHRHILNRKNISRRYPNTFKTIISEFAKYVYLKSTFNKKNKYYKERIKNLIIPYQTTGNHIFSATFLNKINLLGINYNFYLRDWDHNAFPYCNKGFFHFKKTINELLDLASIS